MNLQGQNANLEQEIKKIIEALEKILREDIPELRHILDFAKRQEGGRVTIDFLEFFKQQLLSLGIEVSKIHSECEKIINNKEILDIFTDLEVNIKAIINAIDKDITLAIKNNQQILFINVQQLSSDIDKITQIINKLTGELRYIITISSIKEKKEATKVGDSVKKIAKDAGEAVVTKTKKGLKTIREKTKEEIKIKLPKIINILYLIIIIITAIFTYIFGNLIILAVNAILLAIMLVFLAILGRKSVFWIISSFAIGMIASIIIYVIFHTSFSRVICVFMPTLCPEKIERHTEKHVEEIKKSILETIDKIKYILENPELAYIEHMAEAEATRKAYEYVFEIQGVNEIPINYLFYSSDEKTKQTYPIPLYYAIRYALPIDREFNIVFNSYCLIELSFKRECITDSTLPNLGNLVRYDDKEVFFNRDLNFYGPARISNKIGITSIKCTVPSFDIDLSNCDYLTWGYFYINNNFLFLISNVSTRTVYKFLVVDESTLIKSILDGRDIYDYLKLNRFEYDKGYFEGFLDFPKINILRLGVLSDYPVIKFKDMQNISDFIYISLANIEEISDIRKLSIEIIYDPKYLEIDLDPKFDKIETALYTFSCNKRDGLIECNAVFRKYYDNFNRNLYLVYYRTRSKKLFFFIPIVIKFSKDFTEYSEVVISARAEYDIEKLITTEIEYRVVKL